MEWRFLVLQGLPSGGKFGDFGVDGLVEVVLMGPVFLFVSCFPSCFRSFCFSILDLLSFFFC